MSNFKGKKFAASLLAACLLSQSFPAAFAQTVSVAAPAASAVSAIGAVGTSLGAQGLGAESGGPAITLSPTLDGTALPTIHTGVAPTHAAAAQYTPAAIQKGIAAENPNPGAIRAGIAPAQAVSPKTIPSPPKAVEAAPQARPDGNVTTLSKLESTGQQITDSKESPQTADGAVVGALSHLFENAAAEGEPAGPTLRAGDGVSGRATGLSPPGSLRTLESIKQLKVGAYNVENLFEQVGDHVPDPQRPGRLKKISDRKPKPEWALREEGKIILENDLDVLVMEEVEDVQALEDMNARFLGGAYKVFLKPGNDERGINIAFLVKKDLPFQIEQRTHKDETWNDPTQPGTSHKLFSRDLTSMIFRAPGKTDPLFIFFGTHYKSKRDRPGDPNSDIMRTAQVERTAEIIGRYRKEFGENAPIMLAGDFNGSVNEEKAYDPLYKEAGLTDSFDASPKPLSDKERITHSYHPRDGAAHYAQMDALLVSKALRGVIQSAFVYRYKNADGTVRPIPKTYDEREKNPSDHFPIIITLDFQPFLTKKFPEWTQTPKPAPKPDDGLAEFAADHLKAASPQVRDRVLKLVDAYLSAEKPDRQAAYFLDAAYYDGFETFTRFGRTLDPEVKRQIETMLKVLDAIVPRAGARRHMEANINVVMNTFLPLLGAFDKRGQPPSPAPLPTTPTDTARDFAASARDWVKTSGAAFDAAMADWNQWAADPAAWIQAKGKKGFIGNYTLKNLPEIRKRLAAAASAKEAFARAAAALGDRQPSGPDDVKALFAAWDALREAGAATLLFTEDSYAKDPARQGLIGNQDQNRGHHPGGLETFTSPALAVDRDVYLTLNGIYTSPAQPK